MQTCWLASYPKSGNTWFRIFLANLLFPEQAPVHPNQLPISNLIASAKGPFEEIIGMNTGLLTHEESANLRPGVDQIVARDWRGTICLRKTHDAYTQLPNGQPLMGEPPDFRAIYLLRHPWDVAVSAANHWDRSIEETIEIMCQPSGQNGPASDVNEQFPQRMLSWTGHVLSWLNSPLDVCLLRYESLHDDPLSNFRKATRFLGLPHDDAAIASAIEASAFQSLQKIEASDGFAEAARPKTRFFRSGKTGEGLTRVTEGQLDRLRVMQLEIDQAIEAMET